MGDYGFMILYAIAIHRTEESTIGSLKIGNQKLHIKQQVAGLLYCESVVKIGKSVTERKTYWKP